MILILCAALLLAGVAAARSPGSGPWRLLIEAPARELNAMSWRKAAVLALFAVFAGFMAQLAMADMAMILAVDVVAWIDVFAATLIVTRLAPGWRTLKRRTLEVIHRVRRPRPRAFRPRRPRRPAAPFDDAEPAWAFA